MATAAWAFAFLTVCFLGMHRCSAFITASNNRFSDSECNANFDISGFCAWRVIEAAAGVPDAAGNDSSPLDGQQYVPWLFSNAKEGNLNFVRFFGIADIDGGLSGSPLQTAPGVYNETVFKGMDNVIFNLAKNDLKASIVLIDFWKQTDGVQQYLNWCADNTTTQSVFYTNPKCQQIYQDHVTTVLNRVNTFSGIAYKDDPSIFGWEIINEPRCLKNDPGTEPASADCINGIQTFIDNSAALIKSIDKNHLVTVGEEGFFDVNGDFGQYNPASTKSSGQDFVKNHAGPNIDYASIHLWPDNWDKTILPISFVNTWILQHQKAAATLPGGGKPLVISEFGVKCENANSSCVTSTRNPYQTAVYDAVQQSITAGNNLRGAAFWYLGITGGTNEVYEYTIGFDSPTFTGPIRNYGETLLAAAPGCPSPANATSNPQTAG